MADRNHHLLSLSEVNRFEAPAYTTFSRSLSPSPTRHGRSTIEELDPLLANLSPSSTLQALRANDAVSSSVDGKEQSIAGSIAEASEHERALGIRAALAGKKLREWVEEVGSWNWPQEKFQPPSTNADSTWSSASTRFLEQYHGSLPAAVVQERQDRIEIIKNDMELLEVEELKSYVLGAHTNSALTSTSHAFSTGTAQSPRYAHLDDFTVIITATIVQALPFLARLERLLRRWRVRLFVLRHVPGFLQQLGDTQLAIGSAWTTLRQEIERGADCEMTREAYAAIKAVLQQRVTELARRIDTILDTLEGFEDRIPDRWIDEMENAEADFQHWIVEAERLVELVEFQAQKSTVTQGKSNGEIEKNLSTENLGEAWNAQHDGKTALAANSIQGVMDSSQIGSTGARQKPVDLESDVSSFPECRRGQATAAIGAGTSRGERRTPTHGLFFMRNTLPESGLESEKASFGSYGELANQGDAPRSVFLEGNGQQDELILSNDQRAYEESLESETLFPEDQDPFRRRTSTRKPPPLQLGGGEVEAPLSSGLSHTTSGSSGVYSDMSSPQIMDASQMQFFKTPKEDRFPIWVTQDDSTPSRQANQKPSQSPFGHGRSVSAIEPMTRSRASSHLSDVTINGREFKANHEGRGEDSEAVTSTIPEVQEASGASIESVPRSAVHDVSVHKHSGNESRSRSGSTLLAAATNNAFAAQIAESQRALEAEPTEDEEPSWQASPSLRPRKIRDNLTDTTGINNDPSEQPHSHDGAKDAQKGLQDKLSIKISSILSRIPAPIKLATTPAAKAGEAAAQPKQALTKAEETPPTRPQKSTISTPLTLVPANTRTPSQHPDSEGKLYHLHQPGRDVPIKLFIRLVGNEERVMVRVGGGWADLAEYLKEYAMHHQHQGRRSVSDNKFEIKSLSSSPSTSAVPTATSINTGRSPSTSVSGSTPNNRPNTPGSRQPSGVVHSTIDSPAEQLEGTPMSSTSEPPSTASHSTSSSWRDPDSSLGLAGPKSKKFEISPQKKAWVDGMLNQARHLSYEHKKADTATEQGDASSGKTKRVFLKTKAED